MKTHSHNLLLSLACSAPVLLSCSLPMQQTETAMRIEPVLRVRNSDISAGGFYQLGRYYQNQNRYAQAAEAYRSALRHDPDHTEARSALGTIYSMQGKYAEAVAEFTAILKTSPQLAYLHNNLGYAHYLQGNYAAAVAAFEQAIVLEPQNLRALNNLGLAHHKMGNAEKSRLAFSQAAQAPAAPASFMALATDAASAASSRAAVTESVQLPSLSAASVSVESSAPPVSLAVMPAVASTLAPADRNGSKLAAAPRDSASALQSDTVLVRLFSAAADSSPKPDLTFRLEIANGNGIAGFARKLGDQLARNGVPKPQLTNLNSYRQQRTVIQYRDGFRDEAVRLSRMLQTPPVLLSDRNLRKNIDVRLILGNNVVNKGLMVSQDRESVRLADSGGYAAQF